MFLLEYTILIEIQRKHNQQLHHVAFLIRKYNYDSYKYDDVIPLRKVNEALALTPSNSDTLTIGGTDLQNVPF